jgi:hypothetical protein
VPKDPRLGAQGLGDLARESLAVDGEGGTAGDCRLVGNPQQIAPEDAKLLLEQSGGGVKLVGS